MLNQFDALATIPVKDLGRARQFYEGTLGFSRDSDDEAGVAGYRSGGSKFLVYESEYAGTNQATTATWVVADVKAIVGTLREKGVRFEHYDLPGLTLEGDVHVAGSFQAAWLKDPDGNILHIVSR
jgi:catechol 2,3-dioxygenase-like lactoylglutathione lyase family enzyme